jgi:hypothetical protein
MLQERELDASEANTSQLGAYVTRWGRLAERNPMATRSYCSACGLTFHSVSAFDAHRTGSYGEPIYQGSRTGKSRKVSGHTPPTRRCMTLPEIQALGMTQNAKGWWMLPASTQAPWTQTTQPEGAEALPEQRRWQSASSHPSVKPSSRGRRAASLHQPTQGKESNACHVP